MKHSISFYITLFVIKLKGLKKIFSENPINYKQLRKEDIHSPGHSFFNRSDRSRRFTISKTTITEVKQPIPSNRLLIFLHGGALVYGPAQHHWDSLKQIAGKTNYDVWMCDYPKAPEHTISEISANIDQVYERALEQYAASDITLVGDSAGGTLIITLIQRIIKQNKLLPDKMLLICPVVDPAFTNPAITVIDQTDAVLSHAGVLSAKRMAAENNQLNDPLLSPIVGSFHHFPETILFIAENDITYPDQLLMIKQLEKENINYTVVTGKGMPHIWPLLPFMKEAKVAMKKIIQLLNV
ncbi:alpha/beta hydrolase fold domain-containing protein [Gynurincola endophyticus]|uniref:alpha/beta hydrolase fold domain-containing protein n=1 Tax=Gynurincola endophyticus TaxID=2479004 RepID=UPI000F8C5570|nr:alpha/beta hydrolase [Gynurincola endophyticus]